jgi:glycosyltransferase involved in cell wall biosynthesis
MKARNPIRILLTVSQLDSTVAPYRTVMAIAKYLPRGEFDLTVCTLFEAGYSRTLPILKEFGITQAMVAQFRPRKYSLRHILSSLRDQAIIDRYGPFNIQHSLDYTPWPFEAVMARIRQRLYVYHQRNLNENSYQILLYLKTHLATRIISIADHVTEFLLNQGVPAAKVSKVYNGIDIADIDKQLLSMSSKSRGYILSVGQIQPRKRHEDAIRTLSILASEIPDIRLGIAGQIYDRGYYQELQSLAHDLGVSRRVEFLGGRTDILQLMQQADALVLCSKSEGLPWVILEAMAVGLPVISSAIGGSKEIIDHGRTGLLVPMGDICGYAKALRAVLRQADLAQQLTVNARYTVEQRFSARAMVEHLANVYRELTR